MDLRPALAAIEQQAGCDQRVVEAVLTLALEIAREGREGRSLGTLFTIGAEEQVLAHSRALILDPLSHHARSDRAVTDPQLRGTVKELAQLDGAFVVSRAGTLEAACRYLDAPAADVDVPLGLGSRHIAAASISRRCPAVAVAVSESSVIRVFCKGEIVATLVP
jgi:DNA integrity scanning protein DisA with diadenylate cyclase activity